MTDLKKRITIKEIAKAAGVSVGTVDRVLHNRGEVAQATKKLVRQIAEEGNYSTNVFARTLKLNKIFNIAVVLPEDNEYWKTQRLGIENAAAEFESLGLQVNFFTFDRSDQTSFMNESARAISSGPDGVVIAPLLDKEAREVCQSMDVAKIPYTFVDSTLKETFPLSFVGQDTVQSGFLAAKLLNYGFENGYPAWIIKYSDYDIWNKTVTERIAGFRKFYLENGWNENLITECELTETLSPTEFGNQPLHIFVPNSRAHRVLDWMRQHQIKTIGRVVGYDQIPQNIDELKTGAIDFIINQNPWRQGYLSIRSLYNHLIVNTEVEKLQYMPVEIVTKENLEFTGQ